MKTKHALAMVWVASIIWVVAAKSGHPEDPLDLGSAGDFVILAKSGISTVPDSDIEGDMVVSPIDATAITGFSLIMDGSGEFSTSAQVTGKIYASDYDVPTPTKMTTAISDMETAFTQASLRTIPDTTELEAGDISGLTITPGLHKWSTDVLINEDVTLDAQGDPDAIFIFQISGDLILASGKKVILAAGAQAKNIFWQIEGPVGAVVGTYAHMEGVVLTEKGITIETGASFNGKLLAQTAVTLDQNKIVDSNLIPPPQVELEIISEHGIADLSPGIYTNEYGTILTNSVTGMETLGGTQYVNTGWTMTGNEPVWGSETNMVMAHTNDAVLTWQWSTNYLLDASAGMGGDVTGDTNGFYLAGTNVTVTAEPDIGHHFMGWTGDVSGPTNDATQNLVMDQARTLEAHFAIDQLTLEIVSDYGVGTPPVGLYTNAYGTTLTNHITGTETISGTQYFNVGWTMTGNEPALGSGTNMVMVHTNDAVLTWQWNTNIQYVLNATADPGGSITGAPNGFYDDGANVTVTAVPDIGHHFVGWTGDVSGPTNDATQTLTMDQARTLVAHFDLDVPDCGTPVTLRAPGGGAFMELDLSAMFPGTGWTYEAESSQPSVMSAAITPDDKLRLEALSLGITRITVHAVKDGDALIHSFPVQVVGHPNVLSIEMTPHESWNPRFEQRIVVENDTGIDCPAIGLRLLFSDLESGIVVENQTGLAPEPDGRPMIEFSVDFPDGATQEMSVIYLSTGEFRPDQHPPTVEIQYILPNEPPAPDQEGAPNIESIRVLADGRVVLEFASNAGVRYAIDYMNDFPEGAWVTVPLTLQAGGNRVQWIDYGPPNTFPAPASIPTRVYRVRQVAP